MPNAGYETAHIAHWIWVSITVTTVGQVKVLITGGAGFIGSNLCRALLAGGHSVRVLDDFSSGLVDNITGFDVELIEGSIEDAGTVFEAAQSVDAIVHLAARGSVPRSVEDPVSTHIVNATGTLNVLEAARKERCYFIFSSSSSVYGVNTVLPKREEMWTQPMSPYGASKLAAESYVMAYRAVYGLDVLALRFFNVYGPLQRHDHDYAAVIPKFVWAALQGNPVEIHGDGEQTRDFTHVDSVVGILTDALNRRVVSDRPVNLAFGDRMTVNGIASVLEQILGESLTKVHKPARLGDVRNSLNDPALLHSLFPSVGPVPFTDGITSVVEWMRMSP